MRFLVTSLVLSIVLTVVLNLVVRSFPDAANRGARRLDQWASTPDNRRVRVYFPWKAMVVGSIVLTILVNLLVR